jgi:adenylate cyclase
MLKIKPSTILVFWSLFFFGYFGSQHLKYVGLKYWNPSDLGMTYALRLLDWPRESLDWIERADYDFHVKRYSPGKPSPLVSVVEVSETTLKELGQFPFSRDVYSRVVQRLEAAGASVVAFDMTLHERGMDSSLETLKHLQEEYRAEKRYEIADRLAASIQAFDRDNALVKTLTSAKIPVVLGFSFTNQGDASIGLPESSYGLMMKYTLATNLGGRLPQQTYLVDADSMAPVLSMDRFLEALGVNHSIGHFWAIPDSDSIIRSVPVAVRYKDGLFASLSVQALSHYFKVKPELVNAPRGYRIVGRAENESEKFSIPLNPSGSAQIRYYQEQRNSEGRRTPPFDYIDFSDVYFGRTDPARLAGKIVFIGATAIGLKDIRASPLTEDYPGVEVHATFASNILKGEYLSRDSRYYLYAYIQLVLALGIIGWLTFSAPLWASFGASIFLSGLNLFGIQYLAFNSGVVAPSFLPILFNTFIFVSGVMYRYLTEQQEKKVLRSAFSRYVSGNVVDEILKDQSKLRLGGQKKLLTVMFSDLEGFTKLSEKMDAAFLTQLLNEYFTRMTTIILRQKGTLDKYMGDAIMCFWGAPLEVPDHAKRACESAIEISRELVQLNKEWKEKHGITVGFRIGINTGEMSVGNMGSEQVFSYTVMGDNVNLASRLEAINRTYGTTILMNESTAKGLEGGFLFRRLDRVQVKGKEEPVMIYELLGLRGDNEKMPEWIESYERGLEAYQAGKWDEAEAAFTMALRLKEGDGPSSVFIDRCRSFKLKPPLDWQGVWRMNAK